MSVNARLQTIAQVQCLRRAGALGSFTQQSNVNLHGVRHAFKMIIVETRRGC